MKKFILLLSAFCLLTSLARAGMQFTDTNVANYYLGNGGGLTNTTCASSQISLSASSVTNYLIPCTNGVTLFIAATTNVYLAGLTNLQPGWRSTLTIQQDAIGGHTLVWGANTNWFWVQGGWRFNLTTNANAVDSFDLWYLGTTNVGMSPALNLHP